MSLATSSDISQSHEQPEAKERLLLKCPRSVSGDCVIVRREWQCRKCSSSIEHGFNHMLYCECGAASALSYSFKCADPRHGESYERFNKSQMADLPSLKGSNSTATSDRPCLNILLLGESGVGKSTFINAFANYSNFDSFDDALDGELLSPIYSSFTTTTDDGDEIDVTVGEADGGENCNSANAGESCTQSCRAYKFSTYGDSFVRVIDTPGIGDTRGFEQDEQNVKDILSYIAGYDVLHAILILLKPNEERLTVSLRYCINELLAHLHRDAVSNINFCFTNARSTMFKSGSTRKILDRLLKENPQTSQIRLDKETMYFFDSEAFRYLAAVKRGVTFPDQDKQDYKVSWGRSAEESSRLITRVMDMLPHPVDRTVSLNNVKGFVTAIEIPLACISQAMHDNIEDIRQQRKSLREHYEGTLESVKRLVIVTKQAKVVPLGHLRMVCINSSCGVKVCCDCGSNEKVMKVLDSLVGMRKFCKVFQLGSNCLVCKCPRDSHRRVAEEVIMETVTKVDEDVQKAIEERRSEEDIWNLAIQKLEEKEQCFTTEMEQTIRAAALFTVFVIQNSLLAYNPATEEYLEVRIKEEKARLDTDSSGENAVASLQMSLDNFRDQVRQYRSCGSSGETITYDDVMKMLEKLYNLKESGHAIKSNFEAAHRSQEQYTGWRKEVVVKAKVGRSRRIPSGISSIPLFWKKVMGKVPRRKKESEQEVC